MSENLENQPEVYAALPADLKPEEPKKSILSGLKNKWRLIAGSTLGLILVFSAIYVGFSGKTTLFKGSLLDDFTQQSAISVNTVFDTVFIGANNDARANKLLLNVKYDLPAIFFGGQIINFDPNIAVPTNSIAPPVETEETPPSKPVKGSIEDESDSAGTITAASPNQFVAAGPTINAQVCIHDAEVDAGETEVPEGMVHECFALPSEFRTQDPVDEIFAVNLDKIATELNGTFTVTMFITSSANNGYAIGSTTFTTSPSGSNSFNLTLDEDSVSHGEIFDVKYTSGLTGAQSAALKQLDFDPLFIVKGVEESSEINSYSVEGFTLEGTHNSPLTLLADTHPVGTYNLGLQVDFNTVVVPSSTVEAEKVFRIVSNIEQIELKAAAEESNAFCDAISVTMREAFPTEVIAGQQVFQQYIISNSSDEDITVGFVTDTENSPFTFTDSDQSTELVSTTAPYTEDSAVYLTITPDSAGEYNETISFVARDDESGFSCEPITMNASVTVSSAVADTPNTVDSCNLTTTARITNHSTNSVNFEIDATGTGDSLVDFEVEITNSDDEYVYVLTQDNVSLPVENYNPANGNLDWDGEDEDNAQVPNGEYTATLVASIDGTDSTCTDEVQFEVDSNFTATTDDDDDDEFIVDEDDFEIIEDIIIVDGPESIYGDPTFNANNYYPAADVPGDIPAPVENNVPSNTNVPTNLGFNQNTPEIAGDTGPGALLYPLMFAGSAMIARRRKR